MAEDEGADTNVDAEAGTGMVDLDSSKSPNILALAFRYSASRSSLDLNSFRLDTELGSLSVVEEEAAGLAWAAVDGAVSGVSLDESGRAKGTDETAVGVASDVGPATFRFMIFNLAGGLAASDTSSVSIKSDNFNNGI